MCEELIVSLCSPTLAGIKTGSIFNFSYSDYGEVRREIAEMNSLFSGKGLKAVVLRVRADSVMIYLYRPAKLKKDFANALARDILGKYGYNPADLDGCVGRLVCRLKNSAEFPHEIGLFLGYPPEDVKGFIENKAGEFKTVGTWKVYGDCDAAQKTFDKYKKCSRIYLDKWRGGTLLSRLTVRSA